MTMTRIKSSLLKPLSSAWSLDESVPLVVRLKGVCLGRTTNDESILFLLNRFKDKPGLAKQSSETQTSPTVESGQNGQKRTIENSWHVKKAGSFRGA
jgi:hypothetical protein